MFRPDLTRRSVASSASVLAHRQVNTCNTSEETMILTRQREGQLLYWSIRQPMAVPFHWIKAEKKKTKSTFTRIYFGIQVFRNVKLRRLVSASRCFEASWRFYLQGLMSPRRKRHHYLSKSWDWPTRTSHSKGQAYYSVASPPGKKSSKLRVTKMQLTPLLWINLPTWCNIYCIISTRHVSGLYAHLQEQVDVIISYIYSIWCPVSKL